MRVLRRQLRAWREDFQKIWGRLKTFHRTALGILLAIGMVYGGRTIWIDPLNAKIAEAEEALKESAPPDPIPTIEADSEVQEALAKIEGREGTREKRKKEMEAVAASRPKVTLQNKEVALAEFRNLYLQNHLLAISESPVSEVPSPQETNPRRTRASSRKKGEEKSESTTENAVSKASGKSPLATEKYRFHLEGKFHDIYAFLKETSSYPYPSKIEQIQLGFLLPDENPTDKKPKKEPVLPIPGSSEKLQLKFQFTLYIQEESLR
ncbi:MAG: hypothetical protein Q4D62_06730 [Planctomycetia bacterium]|nr:hypothetical protein [Planctomycetia bacterium]